MTLTPQEKRANLKLIDRNIRYQLGGGLVSWWCENCERKLYYPADAAAKPQCPHCSTQGYTVRMKRYYGGLTLITL